MPLKPQDFLVALKLVALGEEHWTYARLAHELGLSASEAHAAVKRGLGAGLLADASIARAYAAARMPSRPLVAREASPGLPGAVGSSRVDLQACKLEYSIVSPK